MAKAPSPKKEVMSLRIEPKLRYLIDLAARVQRRNITNYVEWALEESLKHVDIGDIPHESSIQYLSDYLWSLSEAKRFIRLATYRNDLLTYEEQKLWNVITKHPYLYLKKCPGAWVDENIKFDDLDADWELLLHASYDHEEPLKILKEAQEKLISPKIANTYLHENEKQKIEEFRKKLKTPQTKEEYEKYTKQLDEFLASLSE